MADIIRNGYGQLEPNHLSAQKTGQIYAQLPAAATITQLENGQFAKYNYADGVVDMTANAGEWMLVYNEVHTYDERDRFYKDFAMRVKDSADGKIYPRLFKTNVGDIFTTNTIKVAGSKRTDVTMISTADVATKAIVGAKYTVNANGFLEYTASPAAGAQVFVIVKVYTLADGQTAFKFQRVQ